MKIRNSSRVLAIVLALMMIVPMISVPAFAEDAFFTQNFETGALSDLVSTSNPSVSIKDLGAEDAHGKVFYFDMNKGPYNDGSLYLIKDQNSGRHKVTEYVTNADGTVSGKVLVTLSGADPVELMFENAVVETQKLNKDSEGALTNAVQLYEVKLQQKLDENGLPAYDQTTWQPIMEEVKGAEWNNYVGAIVTCQFANAYQGGGNIAAHSYLNHPAVDASTVTYSMDINVNHDWNTATEMHGMNGAFRFVSFGRSGNNLIVQPHQNLVLTDGATLLAATDNWFNLSIVADYATATIKVYVNGNYAFTAVDEANASRITAVAGNIPANGLQLIQVNRNSAETRFYDGDLMIDNVAIYKGEVLPAASTVSKYAFSSNFNGETVKYNFSSANELVSFPADSNAMKVDLDTYDEENGVDTNGVKAIDKNLFLSDLPAFSATEGATDYYFEADYYIPSGAEYKFQGQFYSVESDQGTNNWVSIYTIFARGTTAEFQPQGELYSGNPIENYNGKTYHTELPVDKWFTLTHKVNLATGRIEHYVDGVLYAYWYLYRSEFLTNVTVAAGNSGWIVAKPNKINGNAQSTTAGLTSYMAGHGGNYPNGYSEYLMMDNLEVYTDPSLLTVKEWGEVDKSIWSEDYSAKLVNSHAWNLSGRNPISATYTDELDGNMAIRMDLVAPATALNSYKIDQDAVLRGSAVYYVDGIKDVPGFDPNAAIETIIPELTRVWDRTYAEYEIDNKDSYFMVRDGATAYLYGINGAGVTGAEVDETALSLIETRTIYSKDDPTVPAMLEASLGGANTDAPFRIGEGTYAYIEGGNNTYVFSADYYVPATAKGRVESQLIISGGFFDLYRFDFTNGVVENSGLAIKKDAWNKVNMVVTISSGDFNFDIYVNGVFSHSVAYDTFSSLPAGAWSVAKIMKNEGDNAGVFYFDNTSVQLVDAAKVQVKEVPFGTVSATVDGVEVALNGLGGTTMFYGTNIVLGEIDLQAAMAGVVTTEDKASIRIDAPTGLRFASLVDEAKIEALVANGYTVTYGTLIAPKDIVAGQALIHGAAGLKVDVENAGKFYSFDDDASTTHFVGSIVEIKEYNIDRDFTARGYVKAVDAEGATVYFYSETTHTVSIADLAAKLIADGAYAEGDAGYDVVAAFAAKAAA